MVIFAFFRIYKEASDGLVDEVEYLFEVYLGTHYRVLRQYQVKDLLEDMDVACADFQTHLWRFYRQQGETSLE